jgi:hypothetical protein
VSVPVSESVGPLRSVVCPLQTAIGASNGGGEAAPLLDAVGARRQLGAPVGFHGSYTAEAGNEAAGSAAHFRGPGACLRFEASPCKLEI